MESGVEYRRSNLREALVDRALTVLRERGADALSLRELARDVGVSHAAPSRHFSDKSKLLDALALEGFAILGARLADAAASGRTRSERADATARAFIEFATTEANVTEVMFRHDEARDASRVGSSALAALEPMQQLFSEQGDPSGTVAATVFLATLQGIASLVNCGVAPRAAVPELIEDLMPRFFPVTAPAGEPS